MEIPDLRIEPSEVHIGNAVLYGKICWRLRAVKLVKVDGQRFPWAAVGQTEKELPICFDVDHRQELREVVAASPTQRGP